MVEMEFGFLGWWNFWVVVQGFLVVGIIVALAFFIRWGRRKSAILEANESTEGQGGAGHGR
ncbi:hypothetical protein E3T34_01410 [Cryobacterium sp. TMT1-62]|uniref:hypothetical protein n=1 Tax=unclassified Cryobacterium TaxID=2649013 RepID=UPI001069401D|nr:MULTISPECIES: hypothetical protein [unclassified Cryobacterium]TFB54273.1 hypothetical protein E3N94_13110 [Cryobacterium sp. Sr3]TFB60666.1 hypothetical protein E3N86_08770 [Cryobacterium sp. Hz7]TFC32978.1 hypothetical protein E3O28_15305 [Cryobacterium sp. TMT2-14]TFC54671.1 hypothetical protein E3O47_01185 [Cryobacterium sp. TMT2-17-1]TFD36349.1 hypothetical protein E3T34_01410 [Cryobacterium sp. TMT1-62]